MVVSSRVLGLLLIATSLLSLPVAQGVKCGGATHEQTVTHDIQTIHSPGYPLGYESNDECTWVFNAPFGRSMMLQFVAVDFELDDYKGDCDTDYLEIYEGQGGARLVDKWCGTKTSVVKVSDSTVTIRFKSDDLFTAKGFSIRYSYVEPVTAECLEKADKPILVDKAPRYESFQVSPKLPRCAWRIEAKDPSTRLVVELFKPSNISCKDGMYNFYEDGLSVGLSHVSFQYCSTQKPFSKMYLQKSSFTLTFEYTPESKGHAVPDDLILLIYTRSDQNGCSDTDPSLIEIKDAPVFFSLPHAYNARGSACSVSLLSTEPSQSLRLDVMGTSEQEAKCDSDLVSVKGLENGKSVPKECAEGSSTPVYRQHSSEGFEIQPKSEYTTFVRATSVPTDCSGFVHRKKAYSDIVLKETIPSDGGYSNLAHCRYLVSAEDADDIVSLSLHWNPSLTEEFEGMAYSDSITIYDGSDETGNVLFSTRQNIQHALGQDVTRTVASSGRDILVVLDANARLEGNAAHISYHSTSRTCQGIQETRVSHDPKTITSLNYPKALPLHKKCLQHLVSENPNEEIVVEVVDANLPTYCENSLSVVEGEYKAAGSSHVLGRVCGKDRQVFRSPSKDVTLVTWSGEVVGPGGWKVKVYTQARSRSSASSVSGGGLGSYGVKVAHSSWVVVVTLLAARVFSRL